MEFWLSAVCFVCILNLALRGFVIYNQNVKIKILEEEKELAEYRNSSYREEIRMYEIKITDKYNELKECKNVIKLKDELIEKYEEIINDKIKEKLELEKTVCIHEKLNEERKLLENKLHNEIQTLGNKLDEAYHVQDALNDTIIDKMNEIEKLEGKNKSLSNDVSHYQEVIKDLNNEVKTLEKNSVEIFEQLYLEKDKAKNQYDKIKELSDDLTNEKGRIAGLEKLIDKLNIEIGDRSKDKRLLDKYKEIFSNIKFFVDENMGE